MLKVMIQGPINPLTVSDEDVFDSLVEQLCDIGEFRDDDNVLLIAPLGATQEQVDKAMKDIDEMEEADAEQNS